MVSKPGLDPSVAGILSAKGYRVLPTTQHRKFSTVPGWQKMSPDQCAQALRSTPDATGWALVPSPTDPVKLLILDVDQPRGVTLTDVWRRISPVEPLPAGVATVRTASGGLHLYFRPPAAHQMRHPVARFAVGDVSGDTRASSRGNQAIMLGGSSAEGKDGLGTYTWELPFDLDRLPEMPLTVYERVCVGTGATQVAPMPTELHRLRDSFMANIPSGSVPTGTWEQKAHHWGSICGRLWGREKPSREFTDQSMEDLRRIYDLTTAEFDPVRARKSFQNGWKEGYDNLRGLAKRAPLISEVMSEAEALFGGPVTMQTNVDGERATSYVLSVGDKFEAISSIQDKPAVLGLLAQMGGTDGDILSQSALMLQPTWWHVFKQGLHLATNRVKVLGDDVEEFYDRLRQSVRDAANSGLIGETQVEGAPELDDGSGVDQYKWWIQYQNDEATLIMPVKAMRALQKPFSGVTIKHLEDLGEKKKRGFYFWNIPIKDALDPEGVLVKLVRERDLAIKQERYKKGGNTNV